MQEQDTTPEEWRTIPGYPPYYEVSNHGRMRTYLRRGTRRVMETPAPMQGGLIGGYRVHHPRLGSGRHPSLRTHHAVLMAFVGPKPPGHVCRHLNGDPLDNRVGNLAWGTHQQNSDDKYLHGTMCVGSKNGSARLVAADVLVIRHLLSKGTGLTRLARLFDINKSTVARIRDRANWAHLPSLEELAGGLDG